MKSPLHLTIHRSIIVDQVAQFLIATKAVPYGCDIKDIRFYPGETSDDKVQLEVIFNTEELEVVHFDLDKNA